MTIQCDHETWWFGDNGVHGCVDCMAFHDWPCDESDEGYPACQEDWDD